jgi:hypothetical protein
LFVAIVLVPVLASDLEGENYDSFLPQELGGTVVHKY